MPAYQSRRPRKSIKLDRVNPQDFAKYSMIFACEQCSHYSNEPNPVWPQTDVTPGGHCTMGFLAQHGHDRQMKLFNLSGKMAFCRFLEID